MSEKISRKVHFIDELPKKPHRQDYLSSAAGLLVVKTYGLNSGLLKVPATLDISLTAGLVIALRDVYRRRKEEYLHQRHSAFQSRQKIDNNQKK
ncbi:MAG: hypothetical protein AAF582_05225 [Pseudomonadota bacterium]